MPYGLRENSGYFGLKWYINISVPPPNGTLTYFPFNNQPLSYAQQLFVGECGILTSDLRVSSEVIVQKFSLINPTFSVQSAACGKQYYDFCDAQEELVQSLPSGNIPST